MQIHHGAHLGNAASWKGWKLICISEIALWEGVMLHRHFSKLMTLIIFSCYCNVVICMWWKQQWDDLFFHRFPFPFSFPVRSCQFPEGILTQPGARGYQRADDSFAHSQTFVHHRPVFAYEYLIRWCNRFKLSLSPRPKHDVLAWNVTSWHFLFGYAHCVKTTALNECINILCKN